MSQGCPFVIQGPIIKKTEFTPDDKPHLTYRSIQIGYLGGAVKCNVDATILSQCEEGQNVSVSGFVTTNGKEAKFTGTEVQVVEAQQTRRRAA